MSPLPDHPSTIAHSAERPKVLISACLLGANVRYDGGHKRLSDQRLAQWQAAGWLVPFCPEFAGGLPTPRTPSEIAPGSTALSIWEGAGRVVAKDGTDMTAAFVSGALAAVRIALSSGCKWALLTDKSPSCGVHRVYSGHFTGQMIAGMGVTAAALRAHGICVFAPGDLEALSASVAAGNGA